MAQATGPHNCGEVAIGIEPPNGQVEPDSLNGLYIKLYDVYYIIIIAKLMITRMWNRIDARSLNELFMLLERKAEETYALGNLPNIEEGGGSNCLEAELKSDLEARDFYTLALVCV